MNVLVRLKIIYQLKHGLEIIPVVIIILHSFINLFSLRFNLYKNTASLNHYDNILLQKQMKYDNVTNHISSSSLLSSDNNNNNTSVGYHPTDYWIDYLHNLDEIYLNRERYKF